MYDPFKHNKQGDHMDITEMTVTVTKGFYVAGTTEEGYDYEAELYNVRVIAKDGSQWDHKKTWYTAIATQDFDEECGMMYGFTDTREEDLVKAENLANVIELVGSINLAHWVECEPQYGSDAYCNKWGY